MIVKNFYKMVYSKARAMTNIQPTYTCTYIACIYIENPLIYQFISKDRNMDK